MSSTAAKKSMARHLDDAQLHFREAARSLELAHLDAPSGGVSDTIERLRRNARQGRTVVRRVVDHLREHHR